ncbi:MAG: SGNH/GDSL hydrolase family protein [Anaerolineae bacterium]|nr:SGNH/GDSL hydrolase family protein [Anaerolineae bacterium]
MIAVVILNSMLCVAAGTIGLGLLLPQQDTLEAREQLNEGRIVPVGVNVVYSDRFNRDAYYFADGDEVAATLAEYDAMSRAGHWQVHSWTGLTMRPFTGVYLNIDQDGNRVGLPPASEQAGKPPYVVWAFGGSTLFGWGLGDVYTIPVFLQQELQNRLPDRQVIVRNLAVPIYNSSQELALFAANLRLSQPDAAFFFDGVNDVWFTVNQFTQTALVDPLAAVWEQHTTEITHPAQGSWVQINDSFPILRLAHQMGFDLPVQSDTTVPVYAMQGIYAGDRSAQQMAAVTNYTANVTMARSIGEAMGVQTLFFLQPYLTDTVNFPVFRDAIIAQELPNVVDLSGLFEQGLPDQQLILIDDFHYSDAASKVIAARIADFILGEN